LALEPWIVEAALARLGKDRLTREEQETIYQATRMPSKVRWPDWWEIGESGESASSRSPGRGNVKGIPLKQERTEKDAISPLL